ncbi:uncharacterized protein LOC134538572 [Bacillus rossius redtenbacheri]|uniref:uncharacterized protein LOC134538572 n=1 Tax=Bacillus rossius redtenbacheri TaxID=93214 RepID=UPI002FDE07F5
MVAVSSPRSAGRALSLPQVVTAMEELRYAVLAEQTELVQQLLSAVSERDLHEYSEVANSFPARRPLLHLAVLKDNPRLLELLLNKRVFQILINERDAEFHTPLMRAADVGSAACVRLLLAAGANPLLSVVKDGARRDDPGTRRARRKRHTTVGLERGSTATHIAAERGHAEVLVLLLQRPEVLQALELPDGEGRTPLAVAAAAGRPRCLRLLLAAAPGAAAAADDRRRTVLHAAAHAGQEAALRELLRRPELRRAVSRRDEAGLTPLASAVLAGSPGCMSALLDLGADQRVEDLQGNTLLHLASREGHARVLRELLPFSLRPAPTPGSRPEEQHAAGRSGRTAYWWYMKDIRRKNNQGRNCLHLAAASGSQECLELLFLCYASPGCTDVDSIECPDLEEADVNGLTALYIAARSGSAPCVRFLLEHGASLAFTRPAGSRAPLGCARERVVDVVVENIPAGAQIVADVLDECVTLEQDSVTAEEMFALDVDLLCPEGENKMTVAKFLMERSDETVVCEHPLLAAFVHLEWQNRRVGMWYRLVSYLVFLGCVTWYVSHPEEPELRWILLPVSVLVVLFSLPCLLPGQGHWARRVVNTAAMSLPAGFALFTSLVTRDVHWRSVTVLVAWLSVSLHAGVVPVLGRQCALLQHVVLHVSKHLFVFLYVMVGFSLAFHVLYEEQGDFSRVLLFTMLVSTRGESCSRNASAGDLTGNYVSRAVHDDRLASAVTSLLFLLFVVFSLLGVVLLVVFKHGGQFLQRSDAYYKSSYRVGLMHEKIEVDRWVDWLLCWSCDDKKSPSGDRLCYVRAGTVPPDIDDRLWRIITRRRWKTAGVLPATDSHSTPVENDRCNAVPSQANPLRT